MVKYQVQSCGKASEFIKTRKMIAHEFLST